MTVNWQVLQSHIPKQIKQSQMPIGKLVEDHLLLLVLPPYYTPDDNGRK
jgi:hypothetical protein